MSTIDPIFLLAVKALSEKQRSKADAYCGPHESYPIYKDGRQIRAAWDLAGHADDPAAVRACVKEHAEEWGHADLLPPDAEAGEVKKATEPDEDEEFYVAKALTIQKAWTDESGDTHIEGWISTDDRDMERDEVPPEAFAPSLQGYMALGAPLTINHRLNQWPVGHVQKAALVRDGRILAEASHPSDPADFQHFPGTGTGVYGRAVINDPTAGQQVMKGNVRGFSWVGKVTQVERLPGGGRRFLKVSDWRETTIAAFPINTKSVFVAAS